MRAMRGIIQGQARLPHGTRAGQAIAEYAILLGVVAAALAIMQAYAKRGLQAGIKAAADQVGDQLNGIEWESGYRPSNTTLEGQTLDMQSRVETSTHRNLQSHTQLGGIRVTNIQDDETVTTGALPGGVAFSANVVVHEY